MRSTLSFAQRLWGHSLALLDIMLGIEEQLQGKEIQKSLQEPLKILLDELEEWGLQSAEQFRDNDPAIFACTDIMRRRDGYEAWGRGRNVDDLYAALSLEYENLRQLKEGAPTADLRRAKSFAMLLNSWSMDEVVDEHRRVQAERHPDRRQLA